MTIIVRAAEAADSDLLLAWRNDPATRRWSLSHDPVTPAQHARWYRSALADPGITLYIGMRDDAPVGMVRFDHGDDAAEVSINLGPEFRGAGLSAPLLIAALERFRGTVRADVPITARILAGNSRSLRLFAGAGFREVGADGDLVVLELPVP